MYKCILHIWWKPHAAYIPLYEFNHHMMFCKRTVALWEMVFIAQTGQWHITFWFLSFTPLRFSWCNKRPIWEIRTMFSYRNIMDVMEYQAKHHRIINTMQIVQETTSELTDFFCRTNSMEKSWVPQSQSGMYVWALISLQQLHNWEL